MLAGTAALIWHNWRQWSREAQAIAEAEPKENPASYKTWPSRPKVSALVAAWNEAGNIEAHIRSFLALSYPERELVLCAGGSDGTHDLARSCSGPQVKVLEQQPGEGKQAALRRCLAEAVGEVVLLTDADCVFTEEAWMWLIEPLARGAAHVVTGISEPKVEQRDNALVRYQWCRDRLLAHHMPRTTDGVFGRNCALLRCVLDDVRALDRPARTGTDYVLSRMLEAAGYRIDTAPDSRMLTEYPESIRAYVKMWRRWVKNLLIHGPKFGAWKDVWSALAGAGLYSLILAMPATTAVVGTAGWAGSLLLFGAAAANRLRRYVFGARLLGQRLSPTDILRVPLYTAIDMLAVLLALHDSINPRLRSRW